MRQVKLKIINNTFAEILVGQPLIEGCLSFTKVYWQKTRFKKIKKEYQKTLIVNKKYIYTGFIKRVESFCKENNINFSVDGEIEKLIPTNKPYIEGVTFRDYQIEFIEAAIREQTGILVAIMSAGKTLTALGIISCFKGSKSLFVSDETGLMYQTMEEFNRYGFNATQFGDGVRDLSGDIICATVQTLKNANLKKVGKEFDLIFIDECHVGFKSGGMIEKIIGNIPAPIRIGLTATPEENNQEVELLTEGLLGKKIIELNFQDAKEVDIVTDVEVKMIRVPTLKNFEKNLVSIKLEDRKLLKELKSKLKNTYNKIEKENIEKKIKETGKKTNYQYIYEYGIVKNEIRNKIIVREIFNLVNSNKSCIVFTIAIEHISILSDMLDGAGIKHEAVYGIIKNRHELKEKIENKEIMCVLSSTVWGKGTNIKSLDAIINAAGGKDVKAILQKGGRSMRKFEGKDKATIIDFIDGLKYLSKHSEERIEVYKNVGWL